MRKWILSLILHALALLLIAQVFDRFYLEGFTTALLASFVLSILNVIVKPILVVLTLPITILTLGLFLLIINAITLYFTQAIIGPSFVIDGFPVAIVAAILLAAMQVIINRLIKDK